MKERNNIEQEELWNGRLGEGYISVANYIDRVVRPFSDLAVSAVNASPRELILDVGCGCGSTSLSFARAGARVTGIDISRKMIAQAIKKSKGVPNLSFHLGDAASEKLDLAYTHVFSRFGVMFFSEPFAAFKNIYSGLKCGGKITFLCWQALPENEWISASLEPLEPFRQPAQTPMDPRSPGGFAFADRDYVMDILSASQFVNIKIESLRTNVDMGQSIDEIMAFHARVGPLSGILQDLDEERGLEAIAAVKASLVARMDKAGLHLLASAWLVTADA